MKLTVLRHSLRGRRAVQVVIGGVFGLIAAVATLLLGMLDFDAPDVVVNLLAAVFTLWMVGWLLAPIITGGSDETLRAEQFTLLPLRPIRIAVGMLVVSFVGVPPIATLIAFLALLVYGLALGGPAAVIGVLFAVLFLLFVVLLSRTMLAAISSMLTSRKGRELGLILVALLGLSGLGLNYALNTVGPAIISGEAGGLVTVLHILPSGWGPLAVRAGADGDWGTVGLLLGGLLLLLVLLTLAYSALLVRRTTNAAYTGGGGGKKGKATGPNRGRLLPATPMGAVIEKELRTWGRDARRRMALMSTVIVGVVLAVLPVVTPDSDSGGYSFNALPYLGLVVAVFACLQAGNLYGYDGSALWQTLVTPGAERVDVRGRQWAWLLLVGPVAVVLAAVLPGVAGQPSAYPWVAGMLPAILGAGAGLVPLLSVYAAFPVPDQRTNSNPFASGGRPGCARLALQLAIGLLLIAATIPSVALLLVGSLGDLPVLSWLAIPVGLGFGVLTFWWWGMLAHRRLADRGPELFDIVRKER